jgi:FkbM family methyltransferase
VKETWINGRWRLLLPPHRADRPEWPHWEAARLAHMHHHLGSGGHVVYDIGAEEGDLSALWASWGNDVVLFEPNPRVWPNIAAIWQANELDPPVACFAGFAANDSRFERNPDHFAVPGSWVGTWPTSADGPMIPDHGFCNLSERDDLPRIKIDTMAEIVVPPTAITLDIEGAELQALRGAEMTLRNHRPLVWVSVHDDFMRDLYNDRPRTLNKFMLECGYEPTYLCNDHEAHWFWSPTEQGLRAR